MHPLEYHLEDIRLPSVFSKISSLDRYYGNSDSSVLLIVTEATLIELAKTYPNLRYPGMDRIDALLSTAEGDIVFSCVDSLSHPPYNPVPLLNFYYDFDGRYYRDPYDVYPIVRSKEFERVSLGTWHDIADAAALVSRYGINASAFEIVTPSRNEGYPELLQRHALVQIIEGMGAREGFSFLRKAGFVDEFWPELAEMYGIGHSKDHHPEGNVWDHTTETFAYRKTNDITLSLGLLFHDAGKPRANRQDGHMFDKHAEIGASIAGRFMNRLGFGGGMIEDVYYLVRNHMLPPAVSQLPTFRTERTMSSPLFPLLLELYRCDLSSTYRGPDAYYKACKAYRAFLKNTKNPFRSSDGKKLLRLYVEN